MSDGSDPSLFDWVTGSCMEVINEAGDSTGYISGGGVCRVCVCVRGSCANDASGTTVLFAMLLPCTQLQYCLISVAVMVILFLSVACVGMFATQACRIIRWFFH